jgi:hypothetical protein
VADSAVLEAVTGRNNGGKYHSGTFTAGRSLPLLFVPLSYFPLWFFRHPIPPPPAAVSSLS